MDLRSLRPALVLVASPLLASCLSFFATNIPNTEVADNHDNRELVNVSERYRHAVEQRDIRTLLSLASPNYYEDGGTPQGDDDYGLDGLRRLLSVWSEEVKEIRYEMRYHRITFENNGARALVDYTYTGSFTLRRPPLQLPEGMVGPQESLINTDPARGATPVNTDQEVWYRRVADNRLELERVSGGWRIVSGM